MSFEIVRGDYGLSYRGIVEGQDLSAYTAVIFVWNVDDVKILDGKTCTVSYVDPNTFIDFTPEADDFDVEPGSYYGLFKFSLIEEEEIVAVLRPLSFIWKVMRKEP